MRRFEFVEGKSAKFWQAESVGTTFIVEFGRLGTKGQRKEKDFPNEDAAAALDKLAASLGQRSFVVTQAHRRARNALAALGGVNPADHPALASELDRVLSLANPFRLSSIVLVQAMAEPAVAAVALVWPLPSLQHKQGNRLRDRAATTRCRRLDVHRETGE